MATLLQPSGGPTVCDVLSGVLARCSLALTKLICSSSSKYSCSFSVCRVSFGVCLSSYKLVILVLLGCFLGIWSFLEVHYLFCQGLSYLLLISILSNFSSFIFFLSQFSLISYLSSSFFIFLLHIFFLISYLSSFCVLFIIFFLFSFGLSVFIHKVIPSGVTASTIDGVKRKSFPGYAKIMWSE